MQIYVYRTSDSVPIFYQISANNGGLGTGWFIDFGTYKYITDDSSDYGGGGTNLGTGGVLIPGFPSSDGLIEILRDRVKSIAGIRFSITVTDDQIHMLGV